MCLISALRGAQETAPPQSPSTLRDLDRGLDLGRAHRRRPLWGVPVEQKVRFPFEVKEANLNPSTWPCGAGRACSENLTDAKGLDCSVREADLHPQAGGDSSG